MLRVTVTGVLLLASVGVQTAAAQRRASDQPASGSGNSGNTEVSVVGRVGADSYTSRVPGSCKHEPNGSIYDVPAALWTVRADGSAASDIRQLTLTLWRPKDGGPDQVSLWIQARSRSARIDVNPTSRPVGSARVELKPAGEGGTFELTGTDSSGAKLTLTISCSGFTGVEAEGG